MLNYRDQLFQNSSGPQTKRLTSRWVYPWVQWQGNGNRHWRWTLIYKEADQDEWERFFLSFPRTYICVHMLRVKCSHILIFTNLLKEKKIKTISFPVFYLIPLSFFQSIRDARLTCLAHKLGCVDLLKGCEGSPRLLNVPPKDLLCSRITAGAPQLLEHLIAQMP